MWSRVFSCCTECSIIINRDCETFWGFFNAVFVASTGSGEKVKVSTSWPGRTIRQRTWRSPPSIRGRAFWAGSDDARRRKIKTTTTNSPRWRYSSRTRNRAWCRRAAMRFCWRSSRIWIAIHCRLSGGEFWGRSFQFVFLCRLVVLWRGEGELVDGKFLGILDYLPRFGRVKANIIPAHTMDII